MRGFLLRLFVSILALWLTGVLARQIGLDLRVDSFWAALGAVLLLGLFNATLGPLLKLVTLPLNCLTLGLVGFFINIFLFWLVSAIIPGFEVAGFLAACFGSLVMGFLNGVLTSLLAKKK